MPESENSLNNDAQAHRLDADEYVSFGSLSPNLPVTLCERKVALYETNLRAFIGDDENTTARLEVFRNQHLQLQARREETRAVADELITGAQPLHSGFWTGLDAAGLSRLQRLSLGRSRALLAEAQLQVYEGRLSDAACQPLKDVVSQPWSELREDQSVQVCDVSVGTAQSSTLILGALVITGQQALDDPQRLESVFLYVPGNAGGLHAFSSVAHFKRQLVKSLRADPDSFWLGHVSVKHRASVWQALSSDDTDNLVILRVLDGHAFNLGVEDQIASYQEGALQVANGRPLYADASPSRAIERLRLETAENLMAPGNQARELAIDGVAEQRRTALAAAQLPDWIIRASAAVRAEYAKALKVYSRNAAWLEQDINHSLPSFEVFSRDLLADRLKVDLELDINPDSVMVDMPDQVTVLVEQATQGPERPYLAGDELVSSAITDFSTRDEVSVSRSTFDLSALARKNIDTGDERLMLRLKHSRFILQGVDVQTQGFNLAYLIRMIPDLDVATHYSNKITQVFLGDTQAARRMGTINIARRLGVYRQAINLHGWVAHQQGRLTQTALQLLMAATDAGNDQRRGDPFDIEFRYTLLRSPTQRDGSHTEQTLIGISVVHDKLSGLSVMYLPGAPSGHTLFEGSNLQNLISQVAYAVLRDEELLTYLAHCTGARSNPERNKKNINEMLRTGDHGFIVVDPLKSPHMSLTDMQYLARMGLLKEQVYATSTSALEIEHRRLERLYERDLKYTKMGLSLIPGLGTAIGVYDGWNDAVGAVQAFQRGEYKQAALMGLSAGLNLGEAILTLLPLMASPSALSKTLGSLDQAVKQARANLYSLGWQASSALRQRRLSRVLPSVSQGQSLVVKAFDGYEVNLRIYDAIPLTGKNAGVYRYQERLYITRDSATYEVYRRSGEQTLRLKARPPYRTYEPPVRQNIQGRWEYHTDVGGKGGSPFFKLEDSIIDSKPVTHRIPTEYEVPPRILAMETRIAGAETMDRVVIGHRDLFVSRIIDDTGDYPLFRIDPFNPQRFQAQGKLTAEGIYRLNEQPIAPGSDFYEQVTEDFVLINRKFYRVHLDSEQYSWKIVREGQEQRSQLFIESSGSFDTVTQQVVIGNWHLTPQLSAYPGLESLTRQAFGLPASGFDYEMHRYLRQYTRQMIKSADPRVMRARTVEELDALCELRLSKQDLPVARLDEALTAMANKQPLPLWAPVYDELQGLLTVLPMPSGRAYNAESVRRLGNHMLIRELDIEETALLADFAVQRSRFFGAAAAHVNRGQLSEKIVELVMKNRGYTRIEGGNYRGGVHGFDLVLRGPNGDVYVLEVKQLSTTRSTWGAIVISDRAAEGSMQLSDDWVDAVVRSSLIAVPDNPGALAVRQAKANGRLFKLLAAITPDNGVMVFKIKGPDSV